MMEVVVSVWKVWLGVRTGSAVRAGGRPGRDAGDVEFLLVDGLAGTVVVVVVLRLVLVVILLVLVVLLVIVVTHMIIVVSQPLLLLLVKSLIVTVTMVLNHPRLSRLTSLLLSHSKGR